MLTAMISATTITTTNTNIDIGVRLHKCKPNSISELGKLLKLPKT